MGAIPVEVGARGYLTRVDKRVMLIPGVVRRIDNLPAAPP